MITCSRSTLPGILLIAGVIAALLPGDARAQRSVDQNVLQSRAQPDIRIRVAPYLVYLGRADFKVRDVAEGEAHVFAESEGGKLRRVLLVDFEHFHPANDQTFEYPRLTMVKLGGEEYLHQTWALADLEWFHMPEMRELFAGLHLTAEPSWVMDRYVRAVDAAKKHEIIIVYLEAKSVSAPAVHFGRGDDTAPPPTLPAAIEQEVVARASKAFRVEQ